MFVEQSVVICHLFIVWFCDVFLLDYIVSPVITTNIAAAITITTTTTSIATAATNA
jgi:hypothetical protein